MALTRSTIQILETLFSAQAERTPRAHRVYTFWAKNGKGREMDAARQLEKNHLVEVVLTHQKDMYQILLPC